MDFAEDSFFGYLALQLCEYTLDEYINTHLSKEDTHALMKITQEVLRSLSVIHCPTTKVLHRDIKPQNVLIGERYYSIAQLSLSLPLNLKHGFHHYGLKIHMQCLKVIF